jgi:hypothetical protein
MSASSQLPPEDLLNHVLRTYNLLRMGMGIIALLFPFALVILGYLIGVEWQPSLSRYYFAPWEAWNNPTTFPIFQTRILFCGTLCALGAFLYLYRGFSRLENWLLNAAGVFACGVALCPMPFTYYEHFPYADIFEWLGYAHYAFALLLFACMACVVWFCADNTLHYLPTEELRRKFAARYKVLAIAMAAFPLVALAITKWAEAESYFTFTAEALGVFTFAAYWLLKSYELSLSDADHKLVDDAR